MCDEPSTGNRSGASDDAGPPPPASPESGPSALESVEYLPEDGAYRATFDADDVAPSVAVVEAVSVVADADLTDLPPLYSVVDPDALDVLLGDAGGPVDVLFELAGYDVTLGGDRVVMRPPETDG